MGIYYPSQLMPQGGPSAVHLSPSPSSSVPSPTPALTPSAVSSSASQPPIALVHTLGGSLPNFTVADFVTFVIRILIIAAFILAFIFLLLGGLRWVIAGGDEKAVAAARAMIIGTLVGLLIVLSAYALLRLLEFFFGVTIISGEFVIPQIAS